MARTAFGVNDPLAVKIWSKDLAIEALKKTYLGKFSGKGEDNLCQIKTDLKSGAGDKITCGLVIQLNGEGIEGDATLEGNEEALQFFDDAVILNQLRHAASSKGKMSEQRVPYDMRRRCRNGLSDWWARRMETSGFNHLCGNTVETSGVKTAHNTVTAPSTNRIFRKAAAATDQALTSSDTFTLDLIDTAVVKAQTANTDIDSTGPQIRPIRIDGQEMYVMFLHDYQVNDLRLNTSTGQWLDIQKAVIAGGDAKKNPLFTGSNLVGIYNNVVIHKSNYVTLGVHSTTGAAVSDTRRAVLCGAQALTMAFGSENGMSRFSWVENSFDYNNKLGVAAGAIWGMKKTVFTPSDDSSTNAEDFGTMVCTSYAAAPTGA